MESYSSTPSHLSEVTVTSLQSLLAVDKGVARFPPQLHEELLAGGRGQPGARVKRVPWLGRLKRDSPRLGREGERDERPEQDGRREHVRGASRAPCAGQARENGRARSRRRETSPSGRCTRPGRSAATAAATSLWLALARPPAHGRDAGLRRGARAKTPPRTRGARMLPPAGRRDVAASSACLIKLLISQKT